MTVTSRELQNEPTKETAQSVERSMATPVTGNAWAVGIALLAFGIPGWLAGGKYTVNGWIEWGNWFLTWLEVNARIPALAGYWLLLILPAAYVYSEIEVRHRPAWRSSGRWHFSPPLVWAIWLLVVGTDVASTYTGVRVPAADAFLITRQVATDPLFAFAWSSLLTFAPEWLILGGIRFLRR